MNEWPVRCGEAVIERADADAIRVALAACLAAPERLEAIPVDHRPVLLGHAIGEPLAQDGLLRLPPFLLETDAEGLYLSWRPLPQETRVVYRYLVRVAREGGAWRASDPSFQTIKRRE